MYLSESLLYSVVQIWFDNITGIQDVICTIPPSLEHKPSSKGATQREKGNEGKGIMEERTRDRKTEVLNQEIKGWEKSPSGTNLVARTCSRLPPSWSLQR